MRYGTILAGRVGLLVHCGDDEALDMNSYHHGKWLVKIAAKALVCMPYLELST